MMDFIRSQLRRLRRFYREELGHFVWITAAAFLILILLSFAAGYFFAGDFARDMMVWFSQQITDTGVLGDDGQLRALPLFFRNLQAMALGAVCGFFPFIYLSAVSLGFNAMILGLFAAVYVNSGISLLTFLAGILPHGIFELPALVISVACGIFLCRCVTDYVRHNTKGVMWPAVKDVLRVFVCGVLPLVAAAAVIEAYITPLIMGLVI